MILLTEADVREVLPMPDLIDAMETALAEYSERRVQQPLRVMLTVGPSNFFGVMPAFVPASGALATKLVTVFPGNVAAGLPSHLATILLLDPATGAPQAILDGRYITEARTAAVSAVSAKLLAPPDAARVAIIGSGVQARSHLEALAHVRPIREVRVWSPTPARREAFAREMQPLTGAAIQPVDTPERAVRGADLIALVSAAHEPVVRSEWIGEGAHVCAVGACRPDQREMDTALVCRARVFVDSMEGALAEAGDLVIPIREGAFAADRIAGELGQVLAGRIDGRTTASQVTVFKSLGMAVEDAAAAHLAYRRATERGLGTTVRL